MHPTYLPTLNALLPWAQSDPRIRGIVLIGSQARATLASDAYSDLDLMVFVSDPQAVMEDESWFRRFGDVVCHFNEVVPLNFTNWSWRVKRILYTDQRDIDFSILPNDNLDEVLEVNKDILSKGWRVLYDPCGDLLENKLRALLLDGYTQTAFIPSETDLRMAVSELLYHVIWAFKKIKRGELWIATGCINTHMRGLLLQLIEAHNRFVGQQTDFLQYSGRFLEQRTDPRTLAQLEGCFTPYDRASAVAALGHYLDLTRFLWHAICEKNAWPFDPAPFDGIKTIYDQMKANES